VGNSSPDGKIQHVSWTLPTNNLCDLLLDDVSDEAGYHLANFMMELSLNGT